MQGMWLCVCFKWEINGQFKLRPKSSSLDRKDEEIKNPTSNKNRESSRGEVDFFVDSQKKINVIVDSHNVILTCLFDLNTVKWVKKIKQLGNGSMSEKE